MERELIKYVANVFINRNVASDKMWQLSQKALIDKEKKTKSKNIVIGYFSGSISHNPDFELVENSLIKILKKFKNVNILIVGNLKLPESFNEFCEQIIKQEFIDWKLLPDIISNIDINIAPLLNIIFNEAKSENKWVEASLVKIPTVASNYGAFKQVIQQNKTGFLFSNEKDWYFYLKLLINNEKLRKSIVENAYYACIKRYIESSFKIRK